MNVLFSSYLPPWLKQQWQWLNRKSIFSVLDSPLWVVLILGRCGELSPSVDSSVLIGGYPIDGYYIEQFLSCHQDDIRGHVLEVAIATYTKQFGGDKFTRAMCFTPTLEI